MSLILKEYFLNSSLHGFHFIADNRFHWTERLFWIICVLLSWAGSLVLMLMALDQYRTQSVSFTVDTSYLNWQTSFPTIAFCERNHEKSDEKIEILFPDNTQARKNARDIVYYEQHFQELSKCAKTSPDRQRCILGNFSYYMNRVRSSCSELITSCFYKNEEFSCCEEFQAIGSFYGTCFAFNSIVPGKYKSRNTLPFKITQNVDNGYGNLSVELAHGSVFVYGLSQDSVPSEKNAKLILLKSDQVKSIATNQIFNSYLAVKETSTEEDARLIDPESRGCHFYTENDLEHSQVYSMSACENECLIDAQLRICQCALHTFPQINVEQECDMDGLICLDNNAIAIQTATTSCQCSSSCFHTEVNEIGKTIETTSKFRHSKSALRINFIVQAPTIQYTRQLVKTPLSLLVNVGGTIGLFIGASILTIVEVVYYLIIRPFADRYMQRKRQKMLENAKLNERKSLDHHNVEPAPFPFAH